MNTLQVIFSNTREHGETVTIMLGFTSILTSSKGDVKETNVISERCAL